MRPVLRVKLQRKAAGKADRLHFENIALGEKLAAIGQIEALAVIE
jgi:hypothetical protein